MEEQRTEHSPVRPLHKESGKLIGYVCEHCDALFTASMSPSEPQKYVQPNHSFAGRYLPNKAHAARVKARNALK